MIIIIFIISGLVITLPELRSAGQLTDVCRSSVHGFAGSTNIYITWGQLRIGECCGTVLSLVLFACTMSASTPKTLPTSGPKSILDICHPLSAEESVRTPSPDVGNTTGSIGEKVSGSSSFHIVYVDQSTTDWPDAPQWSRYPKCAILIPSNNKVRRGLQDDAHLNKCDLNTFEQRLCKGVL